jgi:hypothetical protein
VRSIPRTFPARSPALAVGIFALAAAAVWAIEVAIVRARPAEGLSDVVGASILADLALFVPALWYLLVRRRGWPRASLVPVVLASLLGAGALLEAAGSRISALVPVAAGIVEACAVGWAVVLGGRVARAARAGGSRLDLAERLEAGFAAVLGAGVAARVFATEAGLAGYALGFGRARRGVRDDAFTAHRESAYTAVLLALLLMALTEGIAVHLLLRRFWPVAILPHLLLGSYGLLWLLGDLGAVRSRRHRIGEDALRLRVGMRFALDVPWDVVDGVEPFDSRRDGAKAPGARRAVALGEPTVVIRLKRPLRARLVYGIERDASTVLLGVDEAARFVRMCSERIAAATRSAITVSRPQGRRSWT